MPDISLYMTFAAGLISFLSPCVLPLVPGYLSFISGDLVGRNQGKAGEPDFSEQRQRRHPAEFGLFCPGVFDRIRFVGCFRHVARRLAFFQDITAFENSRPGDYIFRHLQNGADPDALFLQRSAIRSQKQEIRIRRGRGHRRGLRVRLDALHRPHPGRGSDLCRHPGKGKPGDFTSSGLFPGAGSAVFADGCGHQPFPGDFSAG